MGRPWGNRDRYTVDQLKKRVIKSDMLGDYVDSDGNLLYTIYVENNKLAYLVDGKKYYIDAATLKKNPRLSAAGNLYYNSHYGKDKADFKVETRYYCLDSETGSEGSDSASFGYAYIIYNGHAVSSVPAYVNGSFKRDKNLINKELNQDQFYKLYEQSFSKLKPNPAVAKKM